MLKARLIKKLGSFTLDIDIQMDNQILVLWGSSGAGKTTVLHCLAGLINPSSGFVKLDGRTLYSSADRINISSRDRNVGYLFQDYALFPHMTVRENIWYGLTKRQQKPLSPDPLQLLDSFGAGHLLDRYPWQLSGGEKQRIALVRALAVKPRLLLLDEPFSALDKCNKINLRQEIKKLHSQWQIPFILVTHDEDDASFLGDTIIGIEKGRAHYKIS
ncbi:MAG: ATP-binding cassette domain-containing protein [Syntrophomonadaceae bacterium]